MKIDFVAVEGSFLKREFRFVDLETRREKSGDAAGFDLSAGEVTGAFRGPAWSLPRTMPGLNIQGLRGRILPADPSPREPEEGIRIPLITLRNRPGFTVEQVRLRNCELILVLPDTLEDGRMDVEVRDAWYVQEGEVFIDLFWLIRFSDLSLREPEGGSLREKAVRKIPARHIEEHMRDQDLELGFELRVQEGEITGSMSDALVQLRVLCHKQPGPSHKIPKRDRSMTENSWRLKLTVHACKCKNYNYSDSYIYTARIGHGKNKNTVRKQ
ncbi:MAG: hypothetical protein WD708_00925 [Kiritimatiellia bacterium]